MKRRGGYRGDLIHQVKVRVSPDTLTKLQDLSKERDISIAFIIREFIYKGLAALKR